MDTVDLLALREAIVQAGAAGEQERRKRQAEYQKRRAERFEKEKPEHLDRARKVLEELPRLVEKAISGNYADRGFSVMDVLTDDYDYHKIPWNERHLPLREALEHIRKHEGYNNEPYLIMPNHLKPHSAAALVLETCEQLGLNPRLQISGISGSRDAGASIYCYCS